MRWRGLMSDSLMSVSRTDRSFHTEDCHWTLSETSFQLTKLKRFSQLYVFFHFITVVLKVIDSLSFSKMNVFHWHITDSQSFPLQLSSLPDFSRYGAYSPDKVYTSQDVKDLVTYANNRGVRVIPELDAPAHVGMNLLALRTKALRPTYLLF